MTYKKVISSKTGSPAFNPAGCLALPFIICNKIKKTVMIVIIKLSQYGYPENSSQPLGRHKHPLLCV